MRNTATVVLLGLLVALLGCAEKPQTSARNVDSKPWDNKDSAYLAQGYKAGDAAAWADQIRQRTQVQNEYPRLTARP